MQIPDASSGTPIKTIANRTAGFTIIELTVVVAMIAILSAITIPNMRQALARTTEASTKGNLGALRSALAAYYSDNQGTYPTALSALATGGKYINRIPTSKIPSHS